MTLTPDEAVAHLRRRHHIREQGSHNCAECNDPWTPGVGCPTVIVLDAYAGTVAPPDPEKNPPLAVDDPAEFIRRTHTLWTWHGGVAVCRSCLLAWPCPTVVVLDQLKATEAHHERTVRTLAGGMKETHDLWEARALAAEAALADEQAHADRLAERLRSFAERSTYPEDAAAALRDHEARRQG